VIGHPTRDISICVVCRFAIGTLGHSQNTTGHRCAGVRPGLLLGWRMHQL